MEFKEGNNAWLGRHHTAKSNLKNRLSHLGKKHSDATKFKMSKTRLGKFWGGSKEKISNSLKKYYADNPEVRKIMSERQRGEMGSNWQGGIKPENLKIRNSLNTRLWREAVFVRDSYTCQKCNFKNGNGRHKDLNPHHIKNFSQYPELRFMVNNGITFCKNCHNKFHKIYGYKDNTREQVEDFFI